MLPWIGAILLAIGVSMGVIGLKKRWKSNVPEMELSTDETLRDIETHLGGPPRYWMPLSFVLIVTGLVFLIYSINI